MSSLKPWERGNSKLSSSAPEQIITPSQPSDQGNIQQTIANKIPGLPAGVLGDSETNPIKAASTDATTSGAASTSGLGSSGFGSSGFGGGYGSGGMYGGGYGGMGMGMGGMGMGMGGYGMGGMGYGMNGMNQNGPMAGLYRLQMFVYQFCEIA